MSLGCPSASSGLGAARRSRPHVAPPPTGHGAIRGAQRRQRGTAPLPGVEGTRGQCSSSSNHIPWWTETFLSETFPRRKGSGAASDRGAEPGMRRAAGDGAQRAMRNPIRNLRRALAEAWELLRVCPRRIGGRTPPDPTNPTEDDTAPWDKPTGLFPNATVSSYPLYDVFPMFLWSPTEPRHRLAADAPPGADTTVSSGVSLDEGRQTAPSAPSSSPANTCCTKGWE